jgi:uncharacterized protein YjbI with pentapeptide repeats
MRKTTLDGVLMCGARLNDELRTALERHGVDVDGTGLTTTAARMSELIAEHQIWVDKLGKGGDRIQLQRIDLRGYNFANQLLCGAVMRFCGLRGADFSGAKLMMADLSYSDLRDADFTSADLSGCNLEGANLAGAKLWRAKFRKVDLSGDGSRLWPTSFAKARLNGADLRDASLAGVVLRGTDLTAIKTSFATLKGADLSAARGWQPAEALA